VISAYASIGSNVNFCDCYLGGGRDESDHSEVGSGFVHFNFTPFGACGDKATASIFGAVPKSVLLNADRIFLGGSGGVVGPVELGYGVVLAAGGVYRKSYGDGQLVLGETSRARALAMRPGYVPGIHRRLQATRYYVGQLKALSSWYAAVRLSRASDEWEQRLIRHALTRLDEGVIERLKQGDRLIAGARQVEAESLDAASIRSWAQWCESLPSFKPSLPPDAIVTAATAAGSHVEWVRSLSKEAAVAAVGWLEGVVQQTRSMGESV
jgi:UDP-N-acetylglucosamine/UDP-N-acetylgalactosamine diphosphorylase